MVGDNVSFADLMAICEIDQSSKKLYHSLTDINTYLLYYFFSEHIGFNPFSNCNKLSRWYNDVREELGPYYKVVNDDFSDKLKSAEKDNKEAISVKQ